MRLGKTYEVAFPPDLLISCASPLAFEFPIIMMSTFLGAIVFRVSFGLVGFVSRWS